jgi:hypothetical protein
VQDGGAFGARHNPLEQLSAAEQSVLLPHGAKQNAPVDVLTHELPDGHVLWSAGLHAAVHAPPGNSGFVFGAEPTQISPGTAVH